MCKIFRYSRFLSQLLFHLALLSFTGIANSRRLSFKDSLTVYAQENTADRTIPAISTETDLSDIKKWEYLNRAAKTSSESSSFSYRDHEKMGDAIAHEDARDLRQEVLHSTDKIPLWQLGRKILFPEKEIVSTSTSSQNLKTTTIDSFFSTNENEHKPVHETKLVSHMLVDKYHPDATTEFKRESEKSASIYQNVTSTRNSSVLRHEADIRSPRRNKKEIKGSPALKDILWHTAVALWSGHKEHFLPTFLHTKTGGKLSLIRDSVFEPITILSQFKNGVNEINNEKHQNLARLGLASSATAGLGLVIPISRILLTTLQRANSLAWTMTRYIYRLTRHTMLTKRKLKRVIRRLRRRILQRLIRNLVRTNYGSYYDRSPSTIRILANAAWAGKKAIIRFLSRPSRPEVLTLYEPPPSYAPPSPYHGVDNAGGVDITYSSLNKPSNSNFEFNSVPPSSEYLPPPSSFVPPNTYYTTPNAEYVADGHLHASTPPPPLPTQAPSGYAYYHHQLPTTAFTIPSSNYLPPQSKPDLIETPSYSHLLKSVGINPTSYNSKNVQFEFPKDDPALEKLVSPKPTVVYYSSIVEDNRLNHPSPTDPKPTYTNKPPVIYSFDPSPMLPSKYDTTKVNNFDSKTKIADVASAPLSFRVKLLESITAHN